MLRSATGLVLGAALTLAACATPQQATTTHPARTIALPPEIEWPEGIAVDGGGRIYVDSARNGTVVRLGPDGGAAELVSGPNRIAHPTVANFPLMLGLKIDPSGRLWTIGGRSGQVVVLDSDTGKLVKRMAVPREGSVLNDAAVLPDAVYVTDTAQPVLWRIAQSGAAIGEPEAWLDFTGTPLAYGAGRNLNGIVADAAGRYLIVVQMDKGALYRIDLATRAVTPIDIGGAAITNTDGLVLDGQTLYLVRQAEAEIVTMSLAADFGSGKVVSRVTDPTLTWPATAAIRGDELLVVDTQFNRRASDDAVRPFKLVAIPLARLAGD